MKIRSCPVCGSSPFLDKKPLWRDYGYTIHEYKDCYEYSVRCANNDCPCSLIHIGVSTLNNTEEEARVTTLNKWNEYVLNVGKIMKENKNG